VKVEEGDQRGKALIQLTINNQQAQEQAGTHSSHIVTYTTTTMTD